MTGRRLAGGQQNSNNRAARIRRCAVGDCFWEGKGVPRDLKATARAPPHTNSSDNPGSQRHEPWRRIRCHRCPGYRPLEFSTAAAWACMKCAGQADFDVAPPQRARGRRTVPGVCRGGCRRVDRCWTIPQLKCSTACTGRGAPQRGVCFGLRRGQPRMPARCVWLPRRPCAVTMTRRARA